MDPHAKLCVGYSLGSFNNFQTAKFAYSITGIKAAKIQKDTFLRTEVVKFSSKPNMFATIPEAAAPIAKPIC